MGRKWGGNGEGDVGRVLFLRSFDVYVCILLMYDGVVVSLKCILV